MGASDLTYTRITNRRPEDTSLPETAAEVKTQTGPPVP